MELDGTELSNELEQLTSNGELKLRVYSRHIIGQLETRGVIIRSEKDRTSEDMVIQLARVIHDLRQQLIYKFG